MSTPTKTIITNIQTFDNHKKWMGYEITMNDPTKNIICKIDNIDRCCENWGIHTKDNIIEFIGAEFNSIDVSKIKCNRYDEMSIIDITISTDKGNFVLQFYNQHNGYYSHDVYIQTEQGVSIIKL